MACSPLKKVVVRWFVGIDYNQMIAEVNALNERADIDGIVVQMPLPSGVDSNRVARAIAVHKDVDACHPANAATVFDRGTWTSVASARHNDSGGMTYLIQYCIIHD